MQRVRYVLWAWAPLSKRWYQEGAIAMGPEGLRILRAIVQAAPDHVRLKIMTEDGVPVPSEG